MIVEEKKITEEEKQEIREMSDEQLMHVIWFSDCYDKEYCDYLCEEFDRRKLNWDLFKK